LGCGVNPFPPSVSKITTEEEEGTETKHADREENATVVFDLSKSDANSQGISVESDDLNQNEAKNEVNTSDATEEKVETGGDIDEVLSESNAMVEDV
jgi:hypothetical protein